MIEYLISFDEWLLLTLNAIRHPFIDDFVMAFSGKAVWIPMYIAIAACIIWKYGWKRGLILVAACGIAVGLADFTTAKIIRPFFERLRPANIENPLSAFVQIVNDYRGGAFGFPSCHATNTFALATSTALMLNWKKYTIFIFIWTVLQCYSRIYLGVHYPGDLGAGMIIGIAWGTAAYFATRNNIQVAVNHRSIAWLPISVGCVIISVIFIISII